MLDNWVEEALLKNFPGYRSTIVDTIKVNYFIDTHKFWNKLKGVPPKYSVHKIISIDFL